MIDSKDKDGFAKPLQKHKPLKEETEESRQRQKFLNDYTAFEWENLDKEAEQNWYDFDEDNVGNSSAQDAGVD